MKKTKNKTNQMKWKFGWCVTKKHVVSPMIAAHRHPLLLTVRCCHCHLRSRLRLPVIAVTSDYQCHLCSLSAASALGLCLPLAATAVSSDQRRRLSSCSAATAYCPLPQLSTKITAAASALGPLPRLSPPITVSALGPLPSLYTEHTSLDNYRA